MRDIIDKTPLVSVVIPVYNAEKYIEESARRMIGQTYQNVEFIFVDDGSTDFTLRTLYTLKQCDHRIKVIHQSNRYAGVARNTGMAASKGEYLCFWDCDDNYDPQMIEAMVRSAIKFDSDVVFCEDQIFDIDLNISAPKNSMEEEYYCPENFTCFSRSDTPEGIFQISNGWPWDKLFKKTFIQSQHLEFAHTRVANDGYFVFLAMVLARKICKIKKCLVEHKMGGSVSLSNTRDVFWHDGFQMLYEIKESLKQRGIYEDVKMSFMNYALYYLNWSIENMNTLNGMKEAFYEIHNQSEARLNITKNSRDYFSDYSNYDKYLFMQKYNFEDYKKKYVVQFPYDKIIQGSRIVLYAAGKNGKKFFNIVQQNKYAQIVLWMDQKFKNKSVMNKSGIRLGWLDDLKNIDFDIILFTLVNKNIYENVKAMLLKNGVPENKIIFIGDNESREQE